MAYFKNIVDNYNIISKYYDKLHNKFQKNINDTNINNICEKYIQHIRNNNKFLDIGCGTGIYTKIFSKYFKHNYGIDICQNMINICNNNNNNNIVYICESIENFNVNNFDLIISISQVINHFMTFDTLNSFFKNICEKLNENGIFIFDIYNSNFLKNNKYKKEKRILDNDSYYTINPSLSYDNDNIAILSLNNVIYDNDKIHKYILKYKIWQFKTIIYLCNKYNFCIEKITNILDYDTIYDNNTCKLTFIVKKLKIGT